jgi:heme exporter protein B
MGVLRQAAAILRKDLRTELRSREVVVTLVFFSVLVAVLTSVAFFVDERALHKVAAGTIWTAIPFAGVLGLVRVFGREREWDGWTGLLLSPADPVAIYLGKTAFTFVLVTAVELVLVPVVAILYRVPLGRVGPMLALLLALGTLGFSIVGTLFGVLTVRTRARDLMLAVVLLPLLVPALLPTVAATRDLFEGARAADLVPWIRLVAVYDVVTFVGALWTFGSLAEA